MLYKSYGKTGEKVSVIGFGGMRFPSNDGKYDMDYCIQMVKTAFDMGINYFDTAPYYCGGNSEIIFGRAFKSMPRDKFYVSTKSMAKDPKKLREELTTSLERMGVGYIDFFHIWCILTLEDYKEREEAYKEVLKAKEEGLIKHIVASTHCNGKEIAIIAKEGKFEGLTLGYNVLNSAYRQEGLNACQENNLGVVTMNPLGGGIIVNNKEAFSFIKENAKESIVEAAIRFNASHDAITIVLPGMDSIEHVKENASVGVELEKISKERIDTLKSSFGEKFDTLCTGCGYCDSCPKGIEIPKLMQAYNSYLLSSKVIDATNQLKWHFKIDNKQAEACIECGLCERKCTQHLPIIERLKEMATWEIV